MDSRIVEDLFPLQSNSYVYEEFASFRDKNITRQTTAWGLLNRSDFIF